MRAIPARRRLVAVALVAPVLAFAATAFPGHTRAAEAASGSLVLCKQVGGGIAGGATFGFRVTQTGVVRTAGLGDGDCVTFEVPRGGAPLTKGHFRNRPAAVAALLPPGSELVVDGTTLSAVEVQAVLRGQVGGTSLTVNLAQQLLAADLNLLRGVSPPAQVVQAIADANAGLQIVVAPSGAIQVTTTLTQAQVSALVKTLTAFNEGKLKGPASAPLAELRIVEQLPANTLLTITCAPAARCTAADATAGSVTAHVASGETTTVTYANRSSTHGTVELCKTAGTGIAAGTVFTFDTPAGRREVAADGACVELVLPAVNTGDSDGHFRFFERGCGANCADGDQGFAVSAISCSIAARCVDTSLGVGAAVVDVVAGETVTLTYTNRSTRGTVRLCKAAGTGVAAGTIFTFRAPGGERQVAAGACVELVLPEVNTGDSDGHFRFFEEGCGVNCAEGDQGFAVSDISCSPAAQCVDTSLGVGTATVDVVAAQTVTLTFTNRSTRGTVQLCKAAGTGVAAGTIFTFRAPGGERQVAAGACVELVLPEVNTGDSDGHFRFFEEGCGVNCAEGDQGFAVSDISCSPAAQCVHTHLGVGTATVDVVAAQTVTVTFTNRSTRGTVRLCKAAGTGIAVGTPFTFRTPVGDQQVAAGGACLDITLPEVNPDDSDGHFRFYEYGCGEGCLGGAQGFTLASIACSPAVRCVDVSPGVGAATVDVVAAETVTLTFTNQAG